VFLLGRQEGREERRREREKKERREKREGERRLNLNVWEVERRRRAVTVPLAVAGGVAPA